MRIFIAEDQFVTALDLQRQSEQLGHEVTGIASTHDRAVKLILEQKPDVALIDHRLVGEGTGADVANAVTQSMEVGVVFVSAYSPETVGHDLQSPADAFISKPFTPERLRKALATAATRVQLRRELAAKNPRRFELLERSCQGKLNGKEAAELQQLQKDAAKLIDDLCPVDMSEIEALDKRIAQLQANQEHDSQNWE